MYAAFWGMLSFTVRCCIAILIRAILRNNAGSPSADQLQAASFTSHPSAISVETSKRGTRQINSQKAKTIATPRYVASITIVVSQCFAGMTHCAYRPILSLVRTNWFLVI